MKTCKDCLHYEACKDYGVDEVCEELSVCKQFTDRSEWVHLPSNEYTFTIRGDIAKDLLLQIAERQKWRLNTNEF